MALGGGVNIKIHNNVSFRLVQADWLAFYADSSWVDTGAPPALADLPRLPYTEMAIKESMRLYPPAWGIGRRALRDFELNGYRIPANTNRSSPSPSAQNTA